MVLGRGVVSSCFLLQIIVRIWGVGGFTRETSVLGYDTVQNGRWS